MRDPRSNAVSSHIKAVAKARQPRLQPPAHVQLRPGDLPFWNGVVRARARDEWSEADLVVGSQLARCQADIEAQSLILDGEQMVLANERGTMVANPRVAVLEQLARREMALMRTLRMAGRIAGDVRNEAGRRRLERRFEKAGIDFEGEDSLLA